MNYNYLNIIYQSEHMLKGKFPFNIMFYGQQMSEFEFEFETAYWPLTTRGESSGKF